MVSEFLTQILDRSQRLYITTIFYLAITNYEMSRNQA
jgi:hypothetical protein